MAILSWPQCVTLVSYLFGARISVMIIMAKVNRCISEIRQCHGRRGTVKSTAILVHVSHYDDVIMSSMASQITSLTIVYSIVYSGTDQRKHQNSASLVFVQGIHREPVNSPHKWSVTRKMFPFDDVIMQWWPRGMSLLLIKVKDILTVFRKKPYYFQKKGLFVNLITKSASILFFKVVNFSWNCLKCVLQVHHPTLNKIVYNNLWVIHSLVHSHVTRP